MKDFDDLTKDERWDIIYNLIHDVDINDCIGTIYVNVWQDEDDRPILVFDDNKSVKNFNEMIIKEFKEKRTVDYLGDEIDISSEERYANARADKDEYFVNRLTDDDWTFSDEGFVCDECQRWHYYDDRNGVGYVNYFCGDGWIVCSDCLKENDEYIEMYLADKINNPKDANTLLEEDKLKDLGFEKINNDPYENGMYGDNDQPSNILEWAKKQFPNMEFLFNIRKIYNPFTTQFDLYGREVNK